MKEFKKYYVPVEWTMRDELEVKATSLEEAVSFIRKHRWDIPLGTNAEYVEDSWTICDDEGESDKELAHKLKINWVCIDCGLVQEDFRQIYNEYVFLYKMINDDGHPLSYQEFVDKKLISFLNCGVVGKNIIDLDGKK